MNNTIKQFVRNILTEGKNPLDVASFYFKNKPEELKKLTNNDSSLLRKIASLDYEYDKEKFEVGKTFPWLMAMLNSKDSYLMKLIGLPSDSPEIIKFKNAQKLFSKTSFRRELGISDINTFKSIKDFIERVNQSFISSEEIPAMANYSLEEINKDIREGNIAKTKLSNDNFLVITPLKKRGACKYGNTHIDENSGRWCTAKEGYNAFDSYKDGILYIFMDRKDDYKSKYQFYHKEGKNEFKDERNKNFDYKSFFDNNKDVFDGLFPQVKNLLKSGDVTDITKLKDIFIYFPTEYKEEYKNIIKESSGGILNVMLRAGEEEDVDAEAVLKDPELMDLNYDSIEFRRDGIMIDIPLDKVSTEADLSNWYWYYRNGFDGYEFDDYEYNYLPSYLSEEKKKELVDIIKMFKGDFKEEDLKSDDGELYKIMNKANYFDRLLTNFANNYQNAVNEAQSNYIDETFGNLPIEFYANAIFIPYTKFAEYCLEKGINGNTFQNLIDKIIEKEGINDDNLYNYFDNNINYQTLTKGLEEDIDSVKEEIENDMENFAEYNNNSKKFFKYMSDLKFSKQYGNVYFVETDFAVIKVGNPDFEKGTVHMEYQDTKNNKKHEGEVNINDIPRYVTTPMLFESDTLHLRNTIKQMLLNMDF